MTIYFQAVIASTFIPIFSGIMPTRFRGVPVIDGGFSVNQVVIEKGKTLTVSPLSGDAHICPQDHSPGDAAEIMRVCNKKVNYLVLISESIKRLSELVLLKEFHLLQ